jgi:hypothetical protein
LIHKCISTCSFRSKASVGLKIALFAFRNDLAFRTPVVDNKSGGDAEGDAGHGLDGHVPGVDFMSQFLAKIYEQNVIGVEKRS